MTAAPPDMSPWSGPLPVDPAAFDVPHPDPYALALTARADESSRVVDHVNNVVYLAWIDRAAELHADALGWTRVAMRDRGRMWFVGRHEVDYLAEAFPGDALLALTWIRTMRRASAWRDTVIVRPADQTVVCRATSRFVLVELPSRRPIRHDAAMIECFQPLDVSADPLPTDATPGARTP